MDGTRKAGCVVRARQMVTMRRRRHHRRHVYYGRTPLSIATEEDNEAVV